MHCGQIVLIWPKKRKNKGRKSDFSKKKRLSSHEMGEDCQGKRFMCFHTITADERQATLQAFNHSYKSKDSQDAYLATLIQVFPVKRRRFKQTFQNLKLHEHSVKYSLRVKRDVGVTEVNLCANAFGSVFGITKNRVQTIRQSLAETGHPPRDGRGKHQNRPHRLNDEVRQVVQGHISSFRGRASHYALGQTRKLYLSEDLNISKMHKMFKELHPHVKVSYESYRGIFITYFNIGFGYPRKDTCSTCDQFIVKVESLNQQISEAPEGDISALEAQKRDLEMHQQIHKRKADTFYTRKREAKMRAQQNDDFEAVAFDFAKNLPMPNKSTNDIYYRRQLSLYAFNIHVLSTDQVFLYTYDETVGKKGADDVTLMLNDFVTLYLPDSVKEVNFFCDGCAGQNKNYTVLRWMYYVVHKLKRFTDVKLSFPIRGHSYMECDRDMVNVNQRKNVDVPDDWRTAFLEARKKPTPFTVITVTQDMFFRFTDFLSSDFKPSCPVKTRPIREVYININRPQVMLHRSNWNGAFDSCIIVKSSTKRSQKKRNAQQCTTLTRSYVAPLPIKEAKFKDLQVLKLFCAPCNQRFYDNLPRSVTSQSDTEPESDTGE